MGGRPAAFDLRPGPFSSGDQPMSRRKTTEWDGESLEALQARWDRESVHLYGKIDSTNEAARELADEGAPAGTVVLCREQTAGKGRAGHAWYSPRDMISILAGLGVAEHLDERFRGLAPGLKWPNDLVAGGLKLGGVLAEAYWSESGPRHLVLGVGINVRPLGREVPADFAGRATSVAAVLGRSVPLVEVADCVVGGLETWLTRAPASLEGPLLALVDRYDWLRDRRAKLTLPGDEQSQPGTCVGIAPDGALLFRPDRGALRRVTDGVVDPWA